MANERVTRHCDTCSWIQKQYDNLPKNTEDIVLNHTLQSHKLLFHYGQVNRVPANDEDRSEECQNDGGK